MMPDDQRFARLTSLACHDMRTPLATVYGFARTLSRLELGEPAEQYARMIEEATAQVKELLEQLAIVARIEAGRFDPVLGEADTLELAQAVPAELGGERVTVSGEGAKAKIPVEATRRALVQLTRAALRHGGLNEVSLRVSGPELELAPVTRNSAAVLVGEELRELGAASACALVRALGGSVELAEDRLVVRLPQ